MEGNNRKIFVFFKRFKTVPQGARLAGIFADFSGPYIRGCCNNCKQPLFYVISPGQGEWRWTINKFIKPRNKWCLMNDVCMECSKANAVYVRDGMISLGRRRKSQNWITIKPGSHEKLSPSFYYCPQPRIAPWHSKKPRLKDGAFYFIKFNNVP